MGEAQKRETQMGENNKEEWNQQRENRKWRNQERGEIDEEPINQELTKKK